MDINEIKHLIKSEILIERLELEDVTEDEIQDNENLYSEDGLGLDSVEALDIVDGISDVFKINAEVVLSTGEDNNFKTVNEIANYILLMSNNNEN